jgi:hypothetical protein
LPAGEYTVTITDNNGCTSVATMELTEPDSLVIEILGVTHATNGQSNGAIYFGVSGGTGSIAVKAFLNGSPLPGFDPVNLAPGTYQLEAEDANGCTTLSDFIVVENQLSSTAEQEWESRVQIFPNPTGGKAYVLLDLPKSFPVEISVLDVTGRKVFPGWKGEVTATSYPLDLEGFGAGVFWVKIVVGEKVLTKRLVVI